MKMWIRFNRFWTEWNCDLCNRRTYGFHDDEDSNRGPVGYKKA